VRPGDGRVRRRRSIPTTPGRSPNRWPSQRLRFIGELGHRHHRPEHFAADDFVVLLRIGQHGRFEEETVAFHRLAAGDQADVRLRHGAFDEPGDAVAVLRVISGPSSVTDHPAGRT
jgi:hypothetical protein